jgi:molybdopterin-guanine dinucleotide biosynthesis protein A
VAEAECGAAINTTGAVILAGGKSSRMGENKAFLMLDKQTFIERILSQLTHFSEVLISAAPGIAELYAPFGVPVIEDLYAERGPIGGLYTALQACRSPYLLAIGCDKPFFEQGLGEYLAELAAGGAKGNGSSAKGSGGNAKGGGYDAVVPVSRDGRLQPLCAVYAKTCAEFLRGRITAGNYRMTAALECMRTFRVSLADTPFPEQVLSNINTPEEYRAILPRQR